VDLISQIDIIILLFLLAAFIAYFFLSGFIWGAGFQPTPKKDIDLAANLLKLREGMIVYDLGSGTGRILTELAKKYDVKCIGIEIDPLKVWLSRINIFRIGKSIKHPIEVRQGDFLTQDLSDADIVYVFLSRGTNIMNALELKLSRELKEGAQIVSYIHSFPNWKPGIETSRIKVYSIPKLEQKC
jgi:tRNA A58 N-methylase Trm61